MLRYQGRVGLRVVLLCAALLVAAPSGAAYLTQSPHWITPGGQTNSRYGWATRSAGDVNGDGYADVVVGAYLFESGGLNTGAIKVYHGSSGGLQAAPATTIFGEFPDPRNKPSLFSHAVSGAGDVNGDGFDDIIVGAPQHYVNFEAGAAYVYYGSPIGIDPGSAVRLDGDRPLSDFGFDVASAGDVNGDGFADVIVGAPFYTFGHMWEGAAYLFLGSAAGISTTPAWFIEADMHYGGAGWSLDGAGDLNGDGFDDVIVGFYSSQTLAVGTSHGRVRVFHGSPSGLSSTYNWQENGAQAGGFFGHDVTGAGDVNNDGFADVLIGAYRQDNPQQDEGRVYLYLGSAGGLQASPAIVLESNQGSSNPVFAHWGAQMGWAVGPAGDVNFDGFDDVLISLYRFDEPATDMSFDEGHVRLYLGNATTGLDPAWTWSVQSNQQGALFADSVGTAGDVNGDGRGDLIIGTMMYDMDKADEGVAFIYMGTCGTVDADGDGMAPARDPACLAGDVVDCDDTNAGLWSAPGGITGLTTTHSITVGTTFTWERPPAMGGTVQPVYDMIRSAGPADFVTAATCLETADTDRVGIDAANPGPAGTFYYLFRPRNGCPGALGFMGAASDGTPRTARACP